MSRESYFVTVACDCAQGLHAYLVSASSSAEAIAKLGDRCKGEVLFSAASPKRPPCPNVGGDGSSDVGAFKALFEKLYSAGFRDGMRHAEQYQRDYELIDRGREPDEIDETEVEIRP